MYLLDSDLRRDYLSFLTIEKMSNLKDYIIDNELESSAFFALSKFKSHDLESKLFKCIKKPKYSFYYIKHVFDNPISRAIIENGDSLKYKAYLAALDDKFSNDLGNEIVKSKRYSLIKLLIDSNDTSHIDQINKFVLLSKKSLYIYDALLKAPNKQYFLNRLIALHKKTYIFNVMKKYPELNYSKYEDFLIKHKLKTEIKKFLKIKHSDKLEYYLLLT